MNIDEMASNIGKTYDNMRSEGWELHGMFGDKLNIGKEFKELFESIGAYSACVDDEYDDIHPTIYDKIETLVLASYASGVDACFDSTMAGVYKDDSGKMVLSITSYPISDSDEMDMVKNEEHIIDLGGCNVAEISEKIEEGEALINQLRKGIDEQKDILRSMIEANMDIVENAECIFEVLPYGYEFSTPEKYKDVFSVDDYSGFWAKDRFLIDKTGEYDLSENNGSIYKNTFVAVGKDKKIRFIDHATLNYLAKNGKLKAKNIYGIDNRDEVVKNYSGWKLVVNKK